MDTLFSRAAYQLTSLRSHFTFRSMASTHEPHRCLPLKSVQSAEGRGV